MRRAIERGRGGLGRREMRTVIWGGQGAEVREREGDMTKRGIREASLTLSVPLAAKSCRERDGAMGSCGELRELAAPSCIYAPLRPRPVASPPRCGRVPLHLRPAAAAARCISAPLRPRNAASPPSCGRGPLHLRPAAAAPICISAPLRPRPVQPRPTATPPRCRCDPLRPRPAAAAPSC